LDCVVGFGCPDSIPIGGTGSRGDVRLGGELVEELGLVRVGARAGDVLPVPLDVPGEPAGVLVVGVVLELLADGGGDVTATLGGGVGGVLAVDAVDEGAVVHHLDQLVAGVHLGVALALCLGLPAPALGVPHPLGAAAARQAPLGDEVVLALLVLLE